MMTTGPHARRRGDARRLRGWLAFAWRVAIGALVVALFMQFEHPIVSYATHWKGSPTSTRPYTPVPSENRLLRFVAAGDIGDSGKRLERTAAAVTQLDQGDPLDLLLLLGDNVYPAGDPARLPDLVFKPFGEVLASGTELRAILGNHDVLDGHADAQMKALGMPGRWWAVERNDILLVGLDSTEARNSEQRAWLESTLASSSARWKVVALHHPPYSAGYQGSNQLVRATFAPLFERYGVQLVLSGHDHDYQRSETINGVTYIVSGAASGTRRTSSAWFTAESFSWHSFLEIDIYPDHIVGRVLNQDLRIADEWRIPLRTQPHDQLLAPVAR